MKSASFLLTAALLAPITLLFGLSATAAFSLAVAAGLLAIAVHEYAHPPHRYASVPRRRSVRRVKAARLPLAA